MKKRWIGLLAVCLTAVMALTTYAGFDYSQLDAMTQQELQDLQNEITKRLEDYDEEGTEDETVEENEVKADSNWEIEYFIDEFKQPTDKGYITNKGYFTGLFSNSATTDSKLAGYFVVEKDRVGLELFEYGNNEVNNPYSHSQGYSILVLDQKGEKRSYKGSINSKSSRLYFSGTSFLSILKKDGEISIRINEDDSLTSYLFSIDCTGFNDRYTELYG